MRESSCEGDEPSEERDTCAEGPSAMEAGRLPLGNRRQDAFARVPWSAAQCGVALGLTAVLWGVVHLLGRWGSGPVFRLRMGPTLSVWLFCFVVMAGFPLMVAKRRGVLRPLSIRRVLKEFALAIPLTVLAVVALAVIVRTLSAAMGVPSEARSSLAPLADAPNDPRYYLILIPIFTLGPLAEELFFRGLLYNSLRQRIAVPAAVFVQALAFSLVHYQTTYRDLASLGAVFLTGCLLVGVYEWRKTLWAPVMMHCLTNFLFAGPVILLMILNSHTAAKTWEEAAEPPAWLGKRVLPIERQENGEAQRLYAIKSWGSPGMHLWKQEIHAMEAVCAWFPEDRRACARARSAIAMIFQVYLRDPMRAVVEGEWVLSEYEDQPGPCAEALLTIARAYAMLDDLPKSREAYREVLRCYGSFDWARNWAEEELRQLDDR